MFKLCTCSLMLLLLGSEFAAGGEEHYFYCSIRDTKHSTVYYSDVFSRDDNKATKYERAFVDFVNRMYDAEEKYGSCRYTDSLEQARANQDKDRSLDREAFFKNLIDTHWQYTEDQ